MIGRIPVSHKGGIYLKCSQCGCEWAPHSPEALLTGKCPRCSGMPLVKYYKPVFRVNKSERGIWRYSLLPSYRNRFTLGEGLTPVSRVEGVLVKNEKFNPTGLYSDRASALISSALREVKARRVCIEYAHEITRSLVYYLTGMDVCVLANSIFELDPEDVIAFASRDVSVVQSPPDDAIPVYYENPLTVEGLKTIAFELYEQGVKAENVVVPAKSGVLALSLYKGISDLTEAKVETEFQVIAATLKGCSPQVLRGLRDIKVVEVSEGELYETYRRLIKRGFKIKPLASLSYHVAEHVENSVAIVTMGYKARATSKESSVKRLILEVLSRRPLLTAYEIWKEKPVYTLRAFYKAIKGMELKGEVCFEVKTRGVRKVKLYRKC